MPSLLGKAATVTYVLTCVVTLAANYFRVHSTIVTVAIYVSLAITLASGFDYALRLTRFRAGDTSAPSVSRPGNRAAG